MKKAAIIVVAALAAAACDNSFTGPRPVVVSGNTTGTVNSTTGVFIDPVTVGLAVGATAQLSARAADANGTAITSGVTWTSSNTAVATVDSNGAVRGVGPGTAVITATVNGRSGSALVSVS